MKNLDKLAEVVSKADEVFIPSRYQEPFSQAFKELSGLNLPEPSGRRLSQSDGRKIYRWARGRNIPKIVSMAANTRPNESVIGLSGSEWCMEYGLAVPDAGIIWETITEKALGYLAIIAPANRVDSLPSGPLPVVTVFPNLVKELSATSRYRPIPSVVVDGSVESVADCLGFAAVDLVSSGKTLRENGFVVLDELAPVYPALVQAIKY